MGEAGDEGALELAISLAPIGAWVALVAGTKTIIAAVVPARVIRLEGRVEVEADPVKPLGARGLKTLRGDRHRTGPGEEGKVRLRGATLLDLKRVWVEPAEGALSPAPLIEDGTAALTLTAD